MGEGNVPKTLSLKLVGRTPAVYAPHHLRACAYRWMTQLNENAKVLAHWGVLPEMAHNEIVGWSEDVRTNNFIPVLLRGSEHPNETEVFEFLKSLLSENEVEHEEILPGANLPLFEILYHVMVADLTSIYLAVIKGINPWPVEAIDRLKSRLRVRDER
jgi:glucose/mannose-6-phosphate isomerase